MREPSSPRFYEAASLIKRALSLPRSLTLRCVALTGVEENHKVAYIGEGESLGYYRRLGALRVSVDEPVSLLRSGSRAAEHLAEGTLVVVELNRLLGRWVPRGGLFSLPWVRQKVDLGGAAYRSRISKIEATFGRKMRRHGHHCRITRDREQVSAFYRDFYRPYVRMRYGEDAYPRSLAELRAAVRQGFLLKVFAGSDWVAGAVFRVWGKEVSTLAFAASPGDAQRLRQGVLSSVYYFLFRWAMENGMETVDLLRSRPHTGDGVYEHKRRWGARAVLDSWPHTGLWLFPPASGVLPAAFRGHLVWDGTGFVELQQVIQTGE